MIARGTGDWETAVSGTSGFSQKAPGCPAAQSSSELQAAITQLSPSQLPPAASQIAGSQLTTFGGGSNAGASALLPSGPTSGGVAQARTKASISKFKPS